jgi:hypothetical protein
MYRGRTFMIRRVKSRFRQCQKLDDMDRIKNKIIEGRKVLAAPGAFIIHYIAELTFWFSLGSICMV